ncbi:conserved hypothetical protein [Pseudomonas brassicacearum]
MALMAADHLVRVAAGLGVDGGTDGQDGLRLIVPTLRVGMQPVTLRVTLAADASPIWDAERPLRHSHAGAWE